MVAIYVREEENKRFKIVDFFIEIQTRSCYLRIICSKRK